MSVLIVLPHYAIIAQICVKTVELISVMDVIIIIRKNVISHLFYFQNFKDLNIIKKSKSDLVLKLT
jgi:hypothetical protein